MPKDGRKTMPLGPRNAWEAQLERMDGVEPTQASEVESGLEAGDGGGDKGIDADTGGGGYSGDVVEAGIEEAEGEPERPLDSEIVGDPRTRAGQPFPQESERPDDHHPTVSRAAEELDET